MTAPMRYEPIDQHDLADLTDATVLAVCVRAVRGPRKGAWIAIERYLPNGRGLAAAADEHQIVIDTPGGRCKLYRYAAHYCLSGLRGEQTLRCSETPPSRLAAHWSGFLIEHGVPEGLTLSTRPEYVCECDTPERALYIVTDHQGADHPVSYCDGCAAEARGDWNGETAAIRAV